MYMCICMCSIHLCMCTCIKPDDMLVHLCITRWSCTWTAIYEYCIPDVTYINIKAMSRVWCYKTMCVFRTATLAQQYEAHDVKHGTIDILVGSKVLGMHEIGCDCHDTHTWQRQQWVSDRVGKQPFSSCVDVVKPNRSRI